MQKLRSFRLVVGTLMQNALALRWPARDEWVFENDRDPAVGSLVAIWLAPMATEWALSWVLDRREGQHGGPQWLLESVETGRQAWWGNVAFNRFAGPVPPQWRWTDAQHRFDDRWRRLANTVDGYVFRPMPVVFGDGRSATLRARRIFEEAQAGNPSIAVDDWRKVTVRQLAAHHAALVRAHKKLNRARAASPAQEGQ